MRGITILLSVVVASACSKKQAVDSASEPRTPEPTSVVAPVAVEPPANPIAVAIEHADRSADDRARDADRKPAQVLEFFGIKPGDRVVDVAAGKGYYTELLARVVGPDGAVHAQNNKFIGGFASEPLDKRLEAIKLTQIRRLDSELDEPGLPADVDAVLMVLFYHDTVWQKTDRPAFLAAVLASLKPGGVFGVVDHHAESGSGLRDVKTIHRIDVAALKKEVEAAGFVLDGESDALRHPEDDHTKNVFDATIRGKTDRFILRYRKPR